MSGKRIFPNWNTFGVTRDKSWMAKQAANRTAARGLVIQRYRAQNVRMQGPPARLPVTVNTAPRRAVGEMKQVDLNLTTVTINSSGSPSFTLINGVAPGTAKYQRIGNKIQPAFLDLQMFIVNNSTTNNINFKYALIYDRQPTGTMPTYSDIYQNVNAAGTTSSTILTGRNMDTTDRFLTLASEDILFPAQAASAGGMYTKLVRCIRSMRGLAQQFKGSDALLGSISTGAVYLLMFAATDASNTVTVNFDCRFKYHDL